MSVLSTLLNAKRLCKHTSDLGTQSHFLLFLFQLYQEGARSDSKMSTQHSEQPKLCDPTFQVPKSGPCSEKS